MPLNLKICFFGNSKSGKSSIISHLFKEMSLKDTLELEPTEKIEKTNYNSSLFSVQLTEIPGCIDLSSFFMKDEDKKDPQINKPDLSKEFEDIFDQDFFIYIYDVKSKNMEVSLKSLFNFYSKIVERNKKANLFIFFHQIDLGLYTGGNVQETINVFKTKFERSFEDVKEVLYQYQTKKTSIYDYSINTGMIISS